MAENGLFGDLIDFDLGETQSGNENPPEEKEVVEVEETQETSDDSSEDADGRVSAFYEFLVEQGFASQNDEFKGTVDELDQVLQEIPSRITQMVLESTGEAAASLIRYAVTLGPEATVDKLREFFNQAVEPAYEEVKIADDKSAYAYLESKLKGSKFFPTEARLTSYLEGLLESEELVATAQKLVEEDKAAAKARMDEITSQVEAQKAAQEEANRALMNTVMQEIDATPWDTSRKTAVKKALDPAFIQRVNSSIQKSPKAIMQLADLYTYFDEKNGVFDFSTFAAKAQTKEVEKKKEALERGSAQSLISKMKSNPKEKSTGSLWDDIQPLS